MVYDADDFSIIRTVNDLFLFVVVYEDDLLFFCSSYAFCAYHADVFAVIDDDIFAVVRNITAFIGRLEETVRIVYQVFDHA